MSLFQDFMQDQIREIEKYLKKIKESGKTLDNDTTIHRWIEEESETFRQQWYQDHT